MLKGHNLIFVRLPPSLLLHIHQKDVMLIIISLLKSGRGMKALIQLMHENQTPTPCALWGTG
jgi:hypothetical protein